jgi:hypothetical protein
MPRVAYLKLLYAAACAVWLTYVLRMVTAPCAGCNPAIRAAVFCFFLIGMLPAGLGYVLLFKIFPWAGRSLRKT